MDSGGIRKGKKKNGIRRKTQEKRRENKNTNRKEREKIVDIDQSN